MAQSFFGVSKTASTSLRVFSIILCNALKECIIKISTTVAYLVIYFLFEEPFVWPVLFSKFEPRYIIIPRETDDGVTESVQEINSHSIAASAGRGHSASTKSMFWNSSQKYLKTSLSNPDKKDTPRRADKLCWNAEQNFREHRTLGNVTKCSM